MMVVNAICGKPMGSQPRTKIATISNARLRRTLPPPGLMDI